MELQHKDSHLVALGKLIKMNCFLKISKARFVILNHRKLLKIDFTLKEKKEIIDAAKKEPNQSKLAREMSKKWGIEVKRTTVKGILSKKEAIEAAIRAGIPSKRKKLKTAKARGRGAHMAEASKRTESACGR